LKAKSCRKAIFRIDGIVRGSLDCKAKVVIGATGVVDGDIICQNALIEGKFDGTLVVKEMLSLRGTAQVNGDISTQKLVVEAGALFNVTCKMGAQK
jgi:cytoskeletal protein CcmA (bactofilin family)